MESHMPGTVAGGRVFADGKREILDRIPFFTAAPPDLRRALMEAATVVHLEAGAYFLREGDSCAHFAIVVSGRMRVFKLAETGQEITLYHVGAGDICPLNVSCILADGPVPAMARIEEDVEAIIVPAATFRLWMAEHESLRAFVFQTFSNRLGEVMSVVEEGAFRRMDQRLALHLEGLILEVGGARASVETTHAEIAADLGTAREVVSRLLKEFERLGAIRLSRGRIGRRDAAILRRIASREGE